MCWLILTWLSTLDQTRLLVARMWHLVGKKQKTINYTFVFVFTFFTFRSSSLTRLFQILDHRSNTAYSEPFQTYESLNQAARDLTGELQTTREALTRANREQYYTAARLQSDCEALHRAMYTELQQLVLGPQVRSVASSDQPQLCPNAQVGFFFLYFHLENY